MSAFCHARTNADGSGGKLAALPMDKFAASFWEYILTLQEFFIIYRIVEIKKNISTSKSDGLMQLMIARTMVYREAGRSPALREGVSAKCDRALILLGRLCFFS